MCCKDGFRGRPSLDASISITTNIMIHHLYFHAFILSNPVDVFAGESQRLVNMHFLEFGSLRERGSTRWEDSLDLLK